MRYTDSIRKSEQDENQQAARGARPPHGDTGTARTWRLEHVGRHVNLDDLHHQGAVGGGGDDDDDDGGDGGGVARVVMVVMMMAVKAEAVCSTARQTHTQTRPASTRPN